MKNKIKTNWVCVYKTPKLFEANAIKGNLESENIPVVILNRQDSSYLAFGYVEVHVPLENEQEAKNILFRNSYTENNL